MQEYYNLFIRSFGEYYQYLSAELLHPSWHNYFYWLLGLSVFVWVLEIIIPWRKNQPVIRKDFWLDGFYMFFNFFLFSLIGFYAVSNVVVNLFNRFLGLLGIENLVALEIDSWPAWAQYLTLFIVADFIQWNVHRMLHHVNWMWEFHKVHHSVEQMGFAAHLRFHWMENVIYKSIQYIPLAMIGFGLQDFFIVHIIALSVGHLNHANLNISYGPFKYILNNPKMHIWHHAKELPGHPYGANYGITLSIWDYLFRTVYMPASGRDIELGFDNLDKFPHTFLGQLTYGFKKKN
ncbi:MAG: sterol desaturase family protein [Chitinophagales bacterium]